MLWGVLVATVRSRDLFVTHPVSFSLRCLYIRPISRHVGLSVTGRRSLKTRVQYRTRTVPYCIGTVPYFFFRAKDKWGSETGGHKTNGEVDIYEIQILVQAYNGHLDYSLRYGTAPPPRREPNRRIPVLVATKD